MYLGGRGQSEDVGVESSGVSFSLLSFLLSHSLSLSHTHTHIHTHSLCLGANEEMEELQWE